MALIEVPPRGGPSLFGLPMKQVSLIMLTFQNSALILIMHYSRIMPPTGDHRYFASTAVFLNEVLKLAISMTFAIYEASRTLAPQTPASTVFEQLYNAVFSGDGWKLAIPATLYTLQNTLQYVAVGNLDAVHFQILSQLKILTTAVFTVTMLRRALGPRRWLSLVILAAGVSIVSLPPSGSTRPHASTLLTPDSATDHFFPRSFHELGQLANGAGEVARELTKRAVVGLSDEVLGARAPEALKTAAAALQKRSATYQGIQEDWDLGNPPMNYSVGLAAVLVSVVLSGLAGVYFEKVLKESATPVSVWIRNVQLSFYSLFPALFVGVLFKDGEEIARHGFFEGYNWVVWTAILLQSLGGVLASLCINYADNVAKNFATSVSIVLSFLVSVWFFSFRVSLSFLLGTALVMASTYLYSAPERKRGRPPPISIMSYEKQLAQADFAPPLSSADEPRMHLDPLDSVRAISTSRPASPMPRSVSSARLKNRDD